MLNVSVKAVPLGNSKWDLIGAGSGSYYGTVHHESLVQRLTAPSQMALAPTLTISEHLDEVQKEINKLVTQVAKKVVAQWTTIKRVSKPKLDDPIKFRSLTEECIVEAFPDGALTSIALYTNTLILQMVNVLIADLGIDPDGSVFGAAGASPGGSEPRAGGRVHDPGDLVADTGISGRRGDGRLSLAPADRARL